MNYNGQVCVAWLSPNVVSSDFHNSICDLFRLRPEIIGGRIDVRSGGGIVRGRNQAVQQFLTGGDEWLLFVDSDMSFTVDGFDLLMKTADRKKHPIVGGLCFGQDGMVGPFTTLFPTIFNTQPQGGYQPMWEYPRNQLVDCDATGCAFLLIHRSVLLRIQEMVGEGDFSWFGEYYEPKVSMWVSEDVVFCERARAAGYKIAVHTGIHVPHHKGISYALTEAMFEILSASRKPNVDA